MTAFVNDGALPGDPGFVTTSGGVLLLARDNFGNPEPWVTGGTPDSTRRVAPPASTCSTCGRSVPSATASISSPKERT